MNKNCIINRIISLLEKQNRSPKELTDLLGLDKSTFSAWKNGKSRSYSKYIEKIIEFFNVSPAEFFAEPASKTILITAIEQDGLDSRVLPIILRAFTIEAMNDIKSAVENACEEYIRTDEGKKTYSATCHCFNWADFDMHVPNEICRKHGFEKIEHNAEYKCVNWDEQLVIDVD